VSLQISSDKPEQEAAPAFVFLPRAPSQLRFLPKNSEILPSYSEPHKTPEHSFPMQVTQVIFFAFFGVYMRPTEEHSFLEDRQQANHEEWDELDLLLRSVD
jgi:hypothetical protein